MNLSLLGNLRKALLALTVACFVAGVAIAPACDRAALENYRHDPTDRFAEMQWPDRGLGAMLPAPESSYGVIYKDKAQWFNGDVGNYTREQYGACLLYTSIVITMNVRELLHFFELRCCNRAQWEIREMAWKMLELARPTAPYIFADAGAPCIHGVCPEGKMTCGNPYPRVDRSQL